MPALLKPLNKLAQSAAQKTADTRAAEPAAKLSQNAAAGASFPIRGSRRLPGAAQHFR